MMPSHLCAFVRRQFIGRAEFESAPVDVEHYRATASQARRPDVQLEHVLALPAVIPILQKCLLDSSPIVQMLRTIGAVNQGRVFILPRRGRLRRQETIFAACVCAVRNSLERKDISRHVATHRTILCFRDRGAWGAATARLLMSTGLYAV